MVFSGLFPIDGDDFENLRESLGKLKLNDASISYTPESSGALGFGFRCGFLGLLHMEIVKERLEREFDLALIATAPSVEYRVTQTDGTTDVVSNPSELPLVQKIDYIEEPVFRVSIITPKEYTGGLMDLCQTRRGEMKKMEYLSPERVELHYEIPLAEVVVDFFDQLKSRSQGYASLDYELAGYQRANLVRVDILLNGLPADAFSTIVHRDNAESYGRRMCEKFKELIPRQMFDVPIQAAIGGKVISRETVKARRKDVLAKCYGGDITRKRKLLEKQKEGKKKMKSIGRVEVPGDVFISRPQAGRLMSELAVRAAEPPLRLGRLSSHWIMANCDPRRRLTRQDGLDGVHVPVGARQPEREAVLRRAAGVEHRHVGAVHGDAILVDRLTGKTTAIGILERAPVRADAVARRVGRRRRRPRRPPQDDDPHPDRVWRCRRSVLAALDITGTITSRRSTC